MSTDVTDPKRSKSKPSEGNWEAMKFVSQNLERLRSWQHPLPIKSRSKGRTRNRRIWWNSDCEGSLLLNLPLTQFMWTVPFSLPHSGRKLKVGCWTGRCQTQRRVSLMLKMGWCYDGRDSSDVLLSWCQESFLPGRAIDVSLIVNITRSMENK